jgi:hypothetical protein
MRNPAIQGGQYAQTIPAAPSAARHPPERKTAYSRNGLVIDPATLPYWTDSHGYRCYSYREDHFTHSDIAFYQYMQEYNHAVSCYHRGGELTDNPNPLDTVDYLDWERGYLTAWQLSICYSQNQITDEKGYREWPSKSTDMDLRED